MVQHAFSMVLYGMTGYTLMSAIVAGLWGIRALRVKQVEVRANSLEPIIGGRLNVSGPILNVRSALDPAELIDSRPNDGPLALWRNKIVLAVHHDGAGAMPTEWKIVTDRLVHDILFGLIGTPQ